MSGAQAATDLLFYGAMTLWPAEMTAEKFNLAKQRVVDKYGRDESVSIRTINLELYRMFCDEFGVPEGGK